MNGWQLNKYRQLRARGWRAQYALNFARECERLFAVKCEEWEDPHNDNTACIRFVWDYDPYYEPDGDYDTEEEARLLDLGEYEALCCAAYKPRVVLGEYGAYVDGWETAPVAVIGGVVVRAYERAEDGMTRDDYMREIEIDLAYQCGVLA